MTTFRSELVLAAMLILTMPTTAQGETVEPRHELERLVWQGDSAASDAFTDWLKAHQTERVFVAQTLKGAGFRQEPSSRTDCDAFTYPASQDTAYWDRTASIVSCVGKDPIVLLLRLLARPGTRPGPSGILETRQ